MYMSVELVEGEVPSKASLQNIPMQHNITKYSQMLQNIADIILIYGLIRYKKYIIANMYSILIWSGNYKPHLLGSGLPRDFSLKIDMHVSWKNLFGGSK